MPNSSVAPSNYLAFFRANFTSLLLSNISLLLIFFTYHTVLHDMITNWIHDDNSSHGFIVPIVSVYLVWKRRGLFKDTLIAPNWWGFFITLLGSLLLIFGWLASEYFTMRFSFIVVLCGHIIFWYGFKAMSLLAGPIAYLVLMIPIPVIIYDAVAFPLKLFVTSVSVSVMKYIGIMVVREGNIMLFPNITIEVVNACSGLRSLTSLLAIGLAYIMLLVKSQWQKYILVISIFPIALSANMLRVIGTGILAQYFGADAAEGFFHEFAGLVIFLASIGMLTTLHVFFVRWSK